MEIQLSGTVAVSTEGAVVDIGPAKCQAVLAALALSAGRSVAVHQLVEAVWAEASPPTAEKVLQNYVARLRKALGQNNIEWTGGGYRLVIDPLDVDLVRFEALLDEDRYDDALALWHGPPLGSLDAPGLDPARTCLVERWLAADQRRLGEIVDGPKPDLAVSPLSALTTEHGLREELWALLMLALYRSGRQAEALRAFTTLRDRLVDELGVEPSAKVRELEGQILDQDPALDRGSDLRPAPATSRLPPTGTVTFLFTDIEGSTRLWNDHPGEMEQALAEHDRILRSAIETGSGYVFSTAGDSFAAAFARPENALDAAVRAQHLLLAEDWPVPVDIRVRMGLHIGVADEREGEFFGASPSRAARIMAVADGGQIVVSAAARHVLGDELPDGIHLIDEGDHWLRDLDATERLYRVQHPDVSPNRLGPATRVVPPSNLPAQRNSFVGRERQIAEVRRSLAENRLVTLTGVGGVGKTRLALHVGAESLADHRHGVWLVELASVTSSDQVGQRLAGVLGLDELEVAAVVDYLDDKRVLLLLDNCEHVIAPVAQLVEELLDRCAGVTVLATSREGLAVPGERIFAVPPLPVTTPAGLAPASQLFLDRAGQRAASDDQGFSEAIEAICRRLDGVPLAIELAAARTSIMSAAEIATHLDDVFQLLSGGRRTVVERHQTLRATIDWSFELLDEVERTVFCRLGVFVEGFTLPSAVSVAGAEELSEYDVIDAVGRLVDKSLVVSTTRKGTTRFRMLETLRRYAIDRLADRGESESCRRRHAEWAAHEIETFAGRWDSPDQEVALDQLAGERRDLEAAVRWCVEHGEVGLAGRMATGLAPAFLAGIDAASLLQMLYDVPGLEEHPTWPAVLGTTAYVWHEHLDDAYEVWQRITESGATPPASLNLAFARATRSRPGTWHDLALPVLRDRWAANDGGLDIDLLILSATGYGPGTVEAIQPIWRAVIDGQIQAATQTGRLIDRAVTHWIKGHLDVTEGSVDSARRHFEVAATALTQLRAPAMGPQSLSELALLTRTPTEARSLLERLIESTPLDDLGRAERNTRRYIYEALAVILSLLDELEAAALVIGAYEAYYLYDDMSALRDNIAAKITELQQRLGDRFDELRSEGTGLTNDELYRRLQPAIRRAQREPGNQLPRGHAAVMGQPR